MPLFESAYLTKVAASLTAGIIQQAGARFARKLKKTEVEKALDRCCKAALEALVDDGFPDGTDIPRDHLQDVLRQFAEDEVVHDVLAGAIRDGALPPEEIAELRDAFKEAHPLETLPGFDLERAITGFVTAFVDQADEEDAFQGLIQTKELKKQTDHLRELLDESRQQTKLQRKILNRLTDAEKKEETARLRYLRALRRHCLLLPVTRLLGDEARESPVTLDRVYIEMETRTFKKEPKDGEAARAEFLPGQRVEPERLGVLEALSSEDLVVLLGGAGSGKSTVSKALLAALAASALDETADAPAELDPGSLPVLLVLRELSSRLQVLKLDGIPGEKRTKRLAEAVREQATADLAELYRVPEFTKGLARALEEQRCVLALDGLDEVPAGLRGLVREAVLAARDLFRPKKILVTCRTLSYGGGFSLPGFTSHELAPLTREKVGAFCRAWYRAQGDLGRLEESKVEQGGDHLARQVLDEPLNELAGNPLLLTTMAIIHLRKTELPRGRAQVYEDAIQLLVRDWQVEKVGESKLVESEDLQALLANDTRLWKILQHIAFEAHRVGGTGREEAAGLPKGDLWTLLSAKDHLGSAALAEEFLDYADQRAGLLVGLGGKPREPAAFGFVHRTFQEYLAGRYLTSGWYPVAELYERAREADLWDLAVQLGAEALLHVDRKPVDLLRIIYGLGQAHRDESVRWKRATLWAAQMAAILGRAEIEQEREGPVRGDVFLDELRPKLVSLLGSDLPPIERAEAGRALARLGDPRKAVLEVDAMEFCRVPAGRFVMGSAEEDNEASDDEKPQHELDIPYDYWIGQYPVTAAQYLEFVVDGGCLQERFWEEAREHGVWQDGGGKRRLDTSPRIRSDSLDDSWVIQNHPMCGVTWYEALAFCRWLTERWRREGRLPAGWEVCLPSEPEWEKAARGGIEVLAATEPRRAKPGWNGPAEPRPELIKNPNPNRTYPWKGSFSADRGNTVKSGIGTPNAVGCFPAAASPYGCQEMAGNVWEWTRSLFDNYPYPEEPAKRASREDLVSDQRRIVRGGGFRVAAPGARCSARGRNLPNFRSHDFGFRLLVSRSTSDL